MAWSNSISLIDRKTSAFSRSSAARVRLPAGASGTRSSGETSGDSDRYAATATRLAATTVTLNTTTLDVERPLDTSTTAVAASMPASRNNCHGRSP